MVSWKCDGFWRMLVPTLPLDYLADVESLPLSDVVHAAGLSDTPESHLLIRLFAILAISSAVILHGTQARFGLRLQNALGIFMVAVLAFIALAGLFNLADIPGFRGGDGGKALRWDEMWRGTRLDANGLVVGVYTVAWCVLSFPRCQEQTY